MMTFLCSRFGDCEGAGFVADFLSTDMDLRTDEAGARWPAKVRQLLLLLLLGVHHKKNTQIHY
jgi:hypothetical protein